MPDRDAPDGLTAVVAVRWLRSGHRPVLPRGRVLAGVLAWGVGWFSLYNLALNAAEQHLDAGTTALLVNVAPVLVAVLAGVLLGEGFPRRMLVGMATTGLDDQSGSGRAPATLPAPGPYWPYT